MAASALDALDDPEVLVKVGARVRWATRSLRPATRSPIYAPSLEATKLLAAAHVEAMRALNELPARGSG